MAVKKARKAKSGIKRATRKATKTDRLNDILDLVTQIQERTDTKLLEMTCLCKVENGK
jgi:hypothetical protein